MPLLLLAALVISIGAPAAAQTVAPPAAAASAPPQRIQITGGRESETEQRRRSTAAKIVIGREEIEQYGDSTVGEVLRRLPGVTTPGRPGRGGAPRLRGLGAGYTQLLIDGEPIPRGFSLESLTPDQVERIEILRAPTAETGARAIAGTINIVLREGYRRRLNDLRLGAGIEGGEVSPGAFWTWNDTVGDVATNLSGGLYRRRSADRSTVESDTVGGDEPGQSIEQRESASQRLGLNLAARLQWRLGAGGDSLLLSPSLFHADNRSSSTAQRNTLSGAPLYDTALGASEGSVSNLRLNGQWRQRLGPGRIESSLTAGSWRAQSRSQRQEFAADSLLRTRDDDNDIREHSLRLNGKYSLLLGGDEKGANSQHSGVGGAELEVARRTETRSLLQDGLPLLTDFGDNLAANSLRLALYGQDEWTPTPNWALHLGLRWEGIRTVGDLGDGSRPTHFDRVLTPLAHAVWKPDPASRSQVRLSLTRSWRAPSLDNLIARPRPNDRYPLDGANIPTAPDRAGNPELRPELATGVDLAFEHYPTGGGVLSASLFQRRIHDLMRTVVVLESVSWSPVQRWVARTGNVGDATTQGLELEAKGRLDQWFGATWAEAPRTEVRLSASFFRSRVDSVPGPDNRLEQQPGATLNLGADHSWRGLPLKTGFNLNVVPGYQTRTTAAEVDGISARRVLDVYGLWTFDPSLALRISAGNALPRDSDDFGRYDDGMLSSNTRTRTPSDLNLQIRLEMKL
jgi:outer membrane receptor for ferrienterochelin and colicins